MVGVDAGGHEHRRVALTGREDPRVLGRVVGVGRVGVGIDRVVHGILVDPGHVCPGADDDIGGGECQVPDDHCHRTLPGEVREPRGQATIDGELEGAVMAAPVGPAGIVGDRVEAIGRGGVHGPAQGQAVRIDRGWTGSVVRPILEDPDLRLVVKVEVEVDDHVDRDPGQDHLMGGGVALVMGRFLRDSEGKGRSWHSRRARSRRARQGDHGGDRRRCWCRCGGGRGRCGGSGPVSRGLDTPGGQQTGGKTDEEDQAGFHANRYSPRP